MTVKELYEELSKLVEQGKGDLLVTTQHLDGDDFVTAVIEGTTETTTFREMEYCNRKIKQWTSIIELETTIIDWGTGY